MLNVLFAGAVVLIIVVAIVAAMRPDSFRVARSQHIDAAPTVVFPLIDDLQNWRRWSPYERKDPAMKRRFSGSQAGVGAACAWQGDRNVGEGSMRIVESAPPAQVVIQLDFVKPFRGHNRAAFSLQPVGGRTEVTGALSGPSAYLTRLIGLFIAMDRMIGNDFEAGLANLKVLAESGDAGIGVP